MPNTQVQNYNFIQDGAFTVSITFDEAVSGFGSTGMVSTTNATVGSISAMGNEPTRFWSVAVTPTSDSAGTITLTVSGTVMVSGMSESVTGSQTYRFDTKVSVTLTPGALAYTEDSGRNGNYTFNISSTEAILYIDKTDFNIARVSGDEVFDMEYGIVQTDSSGNAFQMLFIPPDGRQGEFSVRSAGHATLSGGVRVDQVIGVSQNIKYNTKIPELSDYYVTPLSAGIWDIYLAFNMPVTGLTETDFIQEGAEINQPAVYRNFGTFNFETTVKKVDANGDNNRASTTDPYTASASGPTYDSMDLKNVVDSVDSGNSWTRTANETATDGNGIDVLRGARYWLLRYIVSQTAIDARNFFNLTLKPNSVWGPTT